MLDVDVANASGDGDYPASKTQLLPGDTKAAVQVESLELGAQHTPPAESVLRRPTNITSQSSAQTNASAGSIPPLDDLYRQYGIARCK